MLPLLLIAAAGIYLLFYLLARQPVYSRDGGKSPGEVRRPVKAILKEPREAVRYEMKDLNLPKMTGLMFGLFVRAAWSGLGRLALAGRMKRASNLDLMAGIYLPESPTLYPTHPSPPDATDHAQSNGRIIQSLLEKEAVRAESRGVVFRCPTIADYNDAFKSGKCTPSDVAGAVLDAIEESNQRRPPLRAIIDTIRDVVMAMAKASEERWSRGKPLSPLDGVPVTIKGEFVVEPYETRGGAAYVPQVAHGQPEATITRKLKEAGAIVIGIANLQEFGAGTLGSNPNAVHLTARNPHDPAHYTGGSSSGSAASVAAGLCPVAIGSDGGGSVRIPAALCGIVGIKPTNRLLDMAGLIPVACSVGSAGPLCASVLDTAIALDVLSEEREGSKRFISLEGVGEGSLEGVKVGIYQKFFEHADAEVVVPCKRAVEQLKALGAEIVDITIPELEEIRVAHLVTIFSEFTACLGIDVDANFDKTNPETLLVIGSGATFSAVEYVNAQKQRTRALQILEHLFATVDVIATPATACTAPQISPNAGSHGELDSVSSGQLIRFMSIGNFTGVPGLVFPVGYTGAGLPVGLQLMGRWYEERTLLKVAMAMEESGAFPQRKPQVFYDIIAKASEKN